MYGIIVVGHGKFGEGLLSSVDLILGKQENVQSVEFKKSDSTEELAEKIKDVIENMDKMEGIIFLTDLAGGTPFNISVMLSRDVKDSVVMGGTNLPLLLEMLMNRDQSNISDIIKKAISSSRDAIKQYEENIAKSREDINKKGI